MSGERRAVPVLVVPCDPRQVRPEGQIASWSGSLPPHRAGEGPVEMWLVLRGHGLVGHAWSVAADATSDAVAPQPDTVALQPDAVLPLGEAITLSALEAEVPDVPWADLNEPVELDEAAVAIIRSLFALRVAPNDGHPTDVVPGTLPAAAIVAVPANRFEQDLELRRACLDHHGTTCSVCRISFGAVYGHLGADFMDVHHIVPLTDVGPDYECDPLADLVPVCPNCHAMLHRQFPNPYTPAEMRRFMTQAPYVEGAVVSDAEERARNEALRMLGLEGPAEQ